MYNKDLNAAGLFQKIKYTAHNQQENADHNNGEGILRSEHPYRRRNHPPKGDTLDLTELIGVRQNVSAFIPQEAALRDAVGEKTAKQQNCQQDTGNGQKGPEIDAGICLFFFFCRP
jgi:hypothetical protein